MEAYFVLGKRAEAVIGWAYTNHGDTENTEL
jgi:hypothetical protein